jgi:hypothetical protein
MHALAIDSYDRPIQQPCIYLASFLINIEILRCMHLCITVGFHMCDKFVIDNRFIVRQIDVRYGLRLEIFYGVETQIANQADHKTEDEFIGESH